MRCESFGPKGNGRSDQQACADHSKRFAENHAGNIGSRGAESHADADLVDASRHGIGEKFFPRDPTSDQFLNLFFNMLPDLFRKFAVEPAARKQSLKPTHDSPRAKTRVIPSSIFSKRDT